jgi:hypothetical protein
MKTRKSSTGAFCLGYREGLIMSVMLTKAADSRRLGPYAAQAASPKSGPLFVGLPTGVTTKLARSAEGALLVSVAATQRALILKEPLDAGGAVVPRRPQLLGWGSLRVRSRCSCRFEA